jgi:hypothetical protein
MIVCLHMLYSDISPHTFPYHRVSECTASHPVQCDSQILRAKGVVSLRDQRGCVFQAVGPQFEKVLAKILPRRYLTAWYCNLFFGKTSIFAVTNMMT